jgi:hypothetical protein
MERFFDGTNQENSKTQGGKAQIRRIQKNKKERKRRDFYVCGGSHTHVFFHQSGTPWGYHPHATLPQENLLIWEPPLQQNSLSKQGSKLECAEGR